MRIARINPPQALNSVVTTAQAYCDNPSKKLFDNYQEEVDKINRTLENMERVIKEKAAKEYLSGIKGYMGRIEVIVLKVSMQQTETVNSSNAIKNTR